MNKFATLLILLLISISCGNSLKEKEILKETMAINSLKINNGFTIKDKEYTLRFEVDNTDSLNPFLTVSIKPHNDSYYISPFSKKEAKGKFYMDLGSYTHLGFKNTIIETPRSIEVPDPFSHTNEKVNMVSKNTSYKQSLLLKTQEDFEVFGRIKFVIEPRCTLEEIPFAIAYKNGKMTIFSPKC